MNLTDKILFLFHFISRRFSGKRFKSSGPRADRVGSNSGVREMKKNLSAATPNPRKSFLKSRQHLQSVRNEKYFVGGYSELQEIGSI